MSRTRVAPQTIAAQETTTRDAPARAGGVTLRAVLLSLVLLVLVELFNYQVEVYRGIDWNGTWAFASGVPAVVPMALLFFLTLAVRLPGLRQLAFTRRELLTIYIIVLVASPVLSHGVLVWILVKNIAYYYTAQAQPYWTETFVRHLPTWWAPGDTASIDGFFEGQSSVPWAAWGKSLFAWGGLLTAIFLCCLCVMSLVQRQWITHERLTFPLAQVPLDLISTETRPSGVGKLTAVPAFWIGFIIAFCLTFLSTLADKVPALPKVPLAMYDAVPWIPVGPLAGIGALTFIFWPWLIALAYLVPTDLSFSIWAFTIIRHLLTIIAIAAGATPMQPQDWWTTDFPAPYYQGAGAVLAFAVWVLWIGRRYFAHVLQVAFRRTASGEDAHEPLPYRVALLGVLLSAGGVVYFIIASECRFFFALGLIFLIIGYFAIWARLRAETGIGFLAFPMQIQDLVVTPLGSSALRINELITLVTLRSIYTPGFSTSSDIFPGTVLESFKISEAAGINTRRLTPAVLLAFVVAVVVGMIIFMKGVYQLGWFELAASRGGWLGPQSIGDGGRIVSWVSDVNSRNPNFASVIALAAGAAVCLFLGAMRLRFYWWPFHPVGYIASNTWGSHWWALPFFIGWLAKVLVTRYGGLRLYRATVPLATGIIVGDLLNGGVWGVLRASGW